MKAESGRPVALAGLATVGQSWHGRVHSIFDRAINVSVGSTLYTLISDPLWISENNILLPIETIGSVRPFSRVRFDLSRLYIDETVAGGYERTQVWRMPRFSFSPVAGLPMIFNRLERLPANNFSKYVESLFLAEAERFAYGQNADFSSVIGAGTGLTPGGDDMLVGLALALLYTVPSLLPALEALCRPLLSGTTEISRHLLDQAFNGKFSAPLVNLLSALQKNNNLAQTLERALRIGGSSGRDGVFGLCHGLSLLPKARVC